MKEVRGEIRHLASPFTLFLPPPTWLRNTLQLECCQSPYGRNVLIETPLLGLNTFMGPDVEGHEVDKKKAQTKKKGQNYLLLAVRITASPTSMEQCQFTSVRRGVGKQVQT